jgi:hypothetical protein
MKLGRKSENEKRLAALDTKLEQARGELEVAQRALNEAEQTAVQELEAAVERDQPAVRD